MAAHLASQRSPPPSALAGSARPAPEADTRAEAGLSFSPPGFAASSAAPRPEPLAMLQNAERFGHRFDQVGASRPKPLIQPPQGVHEQQAHRAAEQVVRLLQHPEPGPAAAVAVPPTAAPASAAVVQRLPSSTAPSGPQALPGLHEAGQPLPEDTRGRMDRAFGASFHRVRIHTSPQADAASRSMGARAFTLGHNVFFRQGEYAPGSVTGQHVLAHELTHVVQQGGAPAAGAQPAATSAVRLTPTAPGGAIQCLMDAEAFRGSTTHLLGDTIPLPFVGKQSADPGLKELEQHLDAYHQLKDPQAKLAKLDELQHAAQAWIQKNPGARRQGGVTGLLDDIQQEHQSVIHNGGKPLDQIHTVDGSEEAQALWQRVLQGNSGKLEIMNEDPSDMLYGSKAPKFPDFQKEVHSNFARLLSRPNGRKLVQKLLDHPKNLGIAPIGRFHSRRNAEVGQVAPYDESAPEAQRWQMARQNLDETGQKQRTHVDPSGTLVGSHALMRFEPGMKDSSVVAKDPSGNALTTPAFLSFGHELIHAKHMMRGRERSGPDAPAVEREWTDAEEHHTIAAGKTSENALRAEHQLGVRQGHTGGNRPRKWDRVNMGAGLLGGAALGSLLFLGATGKLKSS